ncbi:MAG: thioredoxin family protein [Melioribacteraceae bacterium]|nr:thioredoxin family protein [Melioribacteraceae bacterium]
MLSVKVLGTGCKKCQTLEATVKEIIANNKMEATLEKVEDISAIVSYGVMTTPALVINEKVVSAGSLPKEDQILTWLKEG